MSENNFSRRKFLTGAAAIGAAGAMGVGTLSSCTSGGGEQVLHATGVFTTGNPEILNLPPLLDKVPEGKAIKAGVIGCGGRGSGAAMNFSGCRRSNGYYYCSWRRFSGSNRQFKRKR